MHILTIIPISVLRKYTSLSLQNPAISSSIFQRQIVLYSSCCGPSFVRSFVCPLFVRSWFVQWSAKVGGGGRELKKNSVLWNNRFIGQKPNSLHLHILFLGSSMVVRPLEFDIIVCFLNFCFLLFFFFCCLLCISNVQFNSGLTIRVWHFVSLVLFLVSNVCTAQWWFDH